MLFSFLVTASTGLIALGSQGKGPLAGTGYSTVRLAYADFDGHGDEHRSNSHKNDFWKEIHEAMTGFKIFLITIHIVGVVVSSWIHKENLILGIITGRKNAL